MPKVCEGGELIEVCVFCGKDWPKGRDLCHDCKEYKGKVTVCSICLEDHNQNGVSS